LATGNGGVLYPPKSLPPEVSDLELIGKLSATSDDVWLYFMRRQAGWPIRRVPGPKREFIEWSGTQDQSLTALHLTGKKDEHLQAMSDHFGVPGGANAIEAIQSKNTGEKGQTKHRPGFMKRIRHWLTLKKLRKRWAEQRRAAPALAEIAKFPKNADALRHDLPGKLIVSLTSYPPRFTTLDLTIKSLLDQSIKPDKVVLWVADGDADKLHASVRGLQNDLFEIRTCEDLRSFKKIVPALIEYANTFIVIADDDVFYPDNWLRRLTDAFDRNDPTIVYHRGHRLNYLPDGRLAPYKSWRRNVTDEASLLPGTDVMPTGVGGVLYPPGALPPQTTDLALIRRLSETCDDSWLYFMWRQAGWSAKRAPGTMPDPIEWPQTQDQALWSFHRGGKKDEHLRALSEYFGTP
jgi:hypothetical protein